MENHPHCHRCKRQAPGLVLEVEAAVVAEAVVGMKQHYRRRHCKPHKTQSGSVHTGILQSLSRSWLQVWQQSVYPVRLNLKPVNARARVGESNLQRPGRVTARFVISDDHRLITPDAVIVTFPDKAESQHIA